ncbi:MAG: hypothetical protein ACLQMO_17385 [Acidobacteriaceae bacterium]
MRIRIFQERVRAMLEVTSSEPDEHHLSAAVVLHVIADARFAIGPTPRN